MSMMLVLFQVCWASQCEEHQIFVDAYTLPPVACMTGQVQGAIVQSFPFRPGQSLGEFSCEVVS